PGETVYSKRDVMRMNKFKILLMLTMIFSLHSLWGDECGCCGTCCCFDHYTAPRLYISHVEGDTVAYRGGYTSLGLFAAPTGWGNGNWKPFLDVRGHVFNNGKTAANLGGGLRYYSSCLNSVFGVNSYYDYREGPLSHYHQVGVGLEILGPCLDLRLNGYFPVGNKDGESHAHKFTFPRGQFATCRQREEALSGFDAEIGKCFNFCFPRSCRSFCFYAAIGPYFYESRSCADDIWGGQMRFIVQKNCLNLEVGASYDRQYHTSGYARVEISIPLRWPCCEQDCCGDCGLIYQPVHRQEMIVLSKQHCFWKTNFESTH
ncbi:MAG: inverse autotransporter beta domain-containing protein, partial [Parachlamydia sp.]|nr:inverse autotransporter beta domain-containing protein [Parachlamydia sp.]